MNIWFSTDMPSRMDKPRRDCINPDSISVSPDVGHLVNAL